MNLKAPPARLSWSYAAANGSVTARLLLWNAFCLFFSSSLHHLIRCDEKLRLHPPSTPYLAQLFPPYRCHWRLSWPRPLRSMLVGGNSIPSCSSSSSSSSHLVKPHQICQRAAEFCGGAALICSLAPQQLPAPPPLLLPASLSLLSVIICLLLFLFLVFCQNVVFPVLR